MIGKLFTLTVLALAALQSQAFAGAGSPKFSGVAAYYSTHYHGRTASGAPYNPNSYTAAHKTLPFGTRLHVTDKRSGRSVEVVVNDRGPFTPGRVLDLSLAAARQLQMTQRGLARVTASVVER